MRDVESFCVHEVLERIDNAMNLRRIMVILYELKQGRALVVLEAMKYKTPTRYRLVAGAMLASTILGTPTFREHLDRYGLSCTYRKARHIHRFVIRLAKRLEQDT